MHRKTPQSPQRQRGIALITALVIVTMASIAAVSMAHTLQLSIRRTSNILTTDQLYLFALGSEAWARGMLIRDQQDKDMKSYDGLDEDWAKELPPTPIEGGVIQAQITDLQARYNLNNLYLPENSSQQDKDRVTRELELFKRLLERLDLEVSIAQATADWLDQDSNLQFPDGAEDDTYLSNELPYRTGNNRMGSPTELRLIKGVTAEVYGKLLPYITTLPETTTINVNTADPKLLRAIVNKLDDGGAEEIANERKENPFKDKSDFIQKLKDVLDPNDVKSDQIDPVISITSQFYQLETQVQMDDISQTMRSVLNKGDKGVVSLARSIGTF